MQTKVLISGISGFIGSNFRKKWEDKCEILGLDLPKVALDDKVKLYTWNNLEEIPDINTIIHLAGKAHDTKNLSKEKEYFEINTGLTKKIFDHFLNSTAEKFIFFSSVKAIADTVGKVMLDEEAIPNPIGPYGKSKYLAEQYILKHLKEYKQLGKKVYIIRPCMIHGPGNKGNLNLLYNVIKYGIPWPLGKFNNKRSFCSLDNLIYAIGRIVEEDITSGVYNVADDEPLSTNELIDLMNKVKNKRNRVMNLPQGIIVKLAKLGDILHLPLNSQRLQKLTENYVVSNDKLKNALGISQLPIGSAEGIIMTIKSFEK